MKNDHKKRPDMDLDILSFTLPTSVPYEQTGNTQSHMRTSASTLMYVYTPHKLNNILESVKESTLPSDIITY